MSCPVHGPLLQGTVREDGYIFDRYTSDGYPQWLNPKSFHRQRVGNALRNARSRAKAKALPFDIDVDYLISIFPSDGKCPALGIDLVWGGNKSNSPSLDRIEPELGYVRSNVQWLSDRANTIKSDATSAELCAVGTYVRHLELRRTSGSV